MHRTPGTISRRAICEDGQLFRAVATDLDGTLLRSDLTVSHASRRALAAVRARGARHVVVTGRQVASCHHLLTSFDYRDVAICGQGTQIYNMESDRLVWAVTLDRAVASAGIENLRAELGELTAGVATAGRGGHIVVCPGFYSTPGPDCEVVEPHQLWAQPIERAFVRHRTLDAPTLAAQVARVCGDTVTVTYAQGNVVEMLPPGVSKGHALALVADLYDFSPAETIAFGDMPSDIPMLEWAGYRVAMGNADKRLRAFADEIGPTNDDDGVAVVLDRIFAGPQRPASRGRSAITMMSRRTAFARRPGDESA